MVSFVNGLRNLGGHSSILYKGSLLIATRLQSIFCARGMSFSSTVLARECCKIGSCGISLSMMFAYSVFFIFGLV